MTFDSSKAWTQASQAIAANREVVLAVAGVFFLLPQLIFAILFPQPEIASGASEQQVMTVLQAYYASIAPVLIPVLLLQALGTLSLLCLLDTDRRPTVGEAIGAGLRGLLPYLLAQMLMGLALAVLALVIAGVLGAAVGVVGAVIGLALVMVLVFAIGIRLSVIAPLVAIEALRNPVAVLARSWRLTRGHTVRLLGFYALLALAMMVLMIFASILTIPVALLAPVEVAQMVSAGVTSILATVMGVYFVAVIGQVHRQLAGPSAKESASPFE